MGKKMSKKTSNADLWVLMAKVIVEINKELKTIVTFNGDFLWFSGMSVLVVEPDKNDGVVWFYIFPSQVYSVEAFENLTAPGHLLFTYYKDKNNFSDLCELLTIFSKEKTSFCDKKNQEYFKE